MRIGFVFLGRAATALVIILLAQLQGMVAYADEADQSKAEQHFDVMEYRVIGNSVLGNRDIERVLYPLLGPNKTLTDVEGRAPRWSPSTMTMGTARSSSTSRRRRWRAVWCACG